MKHLIEEHGGLLVTSTISLIVMVLFFFYCPKIINSNAPSVSNIEIVPSEDLKLKEKPVVIAQSAYISKDSLFNYINYVKAYSADGKDITDYVQVSEGFVDTSKPGVYQLTFNCTYENVSGYAKASYIVE